MKRLPKGYWTLAKLKKEARKYNSRSEFQRNSRKAYDSAYSQGLLDKICNHMSYKKLPNNYWTLEKLKKEAKKYSSRRDFELNAGGAYQATVKKGWLDEVCDHMEKYKSSYTDEEIIKIARKYNTKEAFKKEVSYIQKIAVKRDLYEEACSHMQPRGNLKKRGIYVYEFSDKSFYVGLTYDYRKREAEHETKKRSAIYKKLQEFDSTLIEYNEFLPLEEVVAEEERVLQEYIRKGWKPLNKAKTGSVGGGYEIWNEETINAEVAKYSNISDFIKNQSGAYTAAKRLGILAEVTSSLGRQKVKQGHWTFETILELAKKYSTKVEFRSENGGAYSAAHKNGWLDEITKHMKKREAPNKYWTKERILKEAAKYKRVPDFNREVPGASAAAKKQKIFNDVIKIIEGK